MSESAVSIETEAFAGMAVRHGFFTRQGGVSDGVYASLNGGVGSRDRPDAVAENRRRMEHTLRVASGRLLVPYQIHSAAALVVDSPFAGERPRCDALVTATPGLALGVTGADCGVLLFADGAAGVIAAAHAGWKGALGGILDATLDAMDRLGAKRDRIVVALGPTIGAASYEVGPEFAEKFVGMDAAYQRFFTPSPHHGAHHMFDLPAFIGHRLARAGITNFTNLALDTYADEARFFSYRRCTHRQEPDYGRHIAAIALAD